MIFRVIVTGLVIVALFYIPCPPQIFPLLEARLPAGGTIAIVLLVMRGLLQSAIAMHVELADVVRMTVHINIDRLMIESRMSVRDFTQAIRANSHPLGPRVRMVSPGRSGLARLFPSSQRFYFEIDLNCDLADVLPAVFASQHDQ